MNRALPAVLILCFTPGAAFAECRPDMTINACLRSADDIEINADEFRSESEAAVTAAQKKDLALTNTGSVDGTAGLLQTALIDYASKVRLGVDSENGGNSGNRGVSIDWSGMVQDILIGTFFDKDGVWKWAQQDHKLTVSLGDGELFEPLAEILTDEQRVELEGMIDDTDDVTIAFSWSPSNQKYGRRISSHSAAFETLFEAAWTDASGSKLVDANQAFIDLLGVAFRMMDGQTTDALEDEHGGIYEAPLEDVLDACPDDQCRQIVNQAMLLIPNAGAVAARLEADLETALNGLDFSMLQKLVGNQPQWAVSLRHREMNDLTGRDETGIKLSYEFGSDNMDDLYAYRADCERDANCIRDFLASRGDAITRGSRLSVSAEYVRKDAYNFSMMGFTPLSMEKEKSLVASGAFSRSYASDALLGGTDLFAGKPGHLDVSVSYENVDNDPMRNDRFLATATFTQEIAQGAFLTLGAVYANKPEYRGQVDEELSARLGVNFKLGASDN